MAVPSFDTRRVLVIAGPTSSGKSSLALSLAEHLPIEIVCMDSMQVYREMQIGTARPEPRELASVPHHLFGFRTVLNPLNAASWAALAEPVIADIQARERIPVLVGGTGLYARALFEGLDALPTIPPELREKLARLVARRGKVHLHRLLARLDPESAARLHPNDLQRVQRALEVRLISGIPIHQLWKKQQDKDLPQPAGAGLYLPRDHLVKRIAAKVDTMLKQGWIEEARQLEKEDLLDAVVATGPIGYGPIREYLAGRTSYERMRDLAIVGTRQYAKRQMTWFRGVAYLQWFLYHPKTGYNVKDLISFMKDRFG